jgi:hypothetical protein
VRLTQIYFLLGLRRFLALSGILFLGAGCVSNHSIRDPSGPDVAEISGSPASGPSGVAITVSAIGNEPRMIVSNPRWVRRLTTGKHRVTVYARQVLLGGSTEFSFDATAGHKYEVRARDGGGFYFLDLIDVTASAEPKVILSGRFLAGNSILSNSVFTQISP